MANEFWLNDQQLYRSRLACREPTRRGPGGPARSQRHHSCPEIRLLLAALPADLCPYTTIYNRWKRWSRRKMWRKLFEALPSLPRATTSTHRFDHG
ncbi:hypothetical protein [Sinorhizobium psoraleae]|uniref:hypothetical protein n=1 Tax=Sinorhizobium psoraleae TaxID=520838 RepID=UPI0015681742|nr:hypothetical protein [Sinorhizobium psoraleae]